MVLAPQADLPPLDSPLVIRVRRPKPTSRWKGLWPLFWFLFALYAVTSAGHTAFADDEDMYYMTQGLVDHHRPDMPRDEAEWLYVPKASDGYYYPKYPPLQPALAIPFYLAGSLVSRLFDPAYQGFITRAAVTMLTAVATAGTAVILALLAAEFGLSPRAAIGLGLLWGTTTIAWPYAKYFWSEPLAGFFLTAAVLFTVRASRHRSARGWLIGGACLVLAVMTRLPMLVSIPGFAVYLIAVLIGKSDERWSALAWRRLAGFGVVVAAPLLVFAFNVLRYGSGNGAGMGTLAFGLAILRAVGNSGEGLRGLLVSPGKSLFLYSPPLLCAVAALPAFARRFPREALLIAAVLAFNLLFIAPLNYWPGDPTWGPRYLVPLTGILILPLTAWFHPRLGSFRRWVVAVLAGAGLAIQMLAILVQFQSYISATDYPEGRYLRYWNPPDSPILGHARIFLERLYEYSPLPMARPPDTRGAAGQMMLGKGFLTGDFPQWSEPEALVRFASSESGSAALWLEYEPAQGQVSITLDGKAIGSSALRFTSSGQDDRMLAALGAVAPGLHQLAIRVASAQPAAGAPPARGLFIRDLAIYQNGLPFGFKRPPDIHPLPVSSEQRWGRAAYGWFNDGRLPHLADIWPWYVAHSGLPPWLAGAVVVPLAGLVLAGVRLYRVVGGPSKLRLGIAVVASAVTCFAGILLLASVVPGAAIRPFYRGQPPAANGTWRLDDNQGRILALPGQSAQTLRVEYIDEDAAPIVLNFRPGASQWQYAEWVLPRDGTWQWRSAELLVPAGLGEDRQIAFTSSSAGIFRPLVIQPAGATSTLDPGGAEP